MTEKKPLSLCVHKRKTKQKWIDSYFSPGRILLHRKYRSRSSVRSFVLSTREKLKSSIVKLYFWNEQSHLSFSYKPIRHPNNERNNVICVCVFFCSFSDVADDLDEKDTFLSKFTLALSSMNITKREREKDLKYVGHFIFDALIFSFVWRANVRIEEEWEICHSVAVFIRLASMTMMFAELSYFLVASSSCCFFFLVAMRHKI